MALKSSKKTNYTLLSQSEDGPLYSRPTPSPKGWGYGHRRLWRWLAPALLAIGVVVILIITQTTEKADDLWPETGTSACPQYPALKATSLERQSLESDIARTIDSESFFNKSLKNMQRAIQIPTEIYDDMGKVGEDSRFDIFAEFHLYLEKAFPLIWSKLEITKVNTWGLFIEWKGEEESLKPFLFMGHQDVVPVLPATVDRWTYPPFSATWDGRFIWGRGASDCKNVVIGVLEAFETLLEKGYKPKRTMLVAFGFDEEISGPQGATFLAKHIEDTKGKDSVELIVDEGGLGIKQLNGATFALPGLGYFDVKVTVETQGGHSSVPPDHTGIGILSQAIAAIEANPYKPALTPVNPFFTTLQCAAEYGPDMDPSFRKMIKKALNSKKAAEALANYVANDSIRDRYLLQTSQATDLISGGVKINALPEKVYAVVNHRIAVESKVQDVKDNFKSVLEKTVIKTFPMALDAWGEVTGNTSSTAIGKITLEDFDPGLEPAPVSPFDSEAYKKFTGTLKQTFGEDLIVAPSLMTGNTDTKFYWDISKNIYRFSPTRDDGRANAHTVDERVGMKEHLEGVKFYAQLVLNGDL